MRMLAARSLAFRRIDDEALLRRVHAGHEAASAELYRRFRGQVYGYCLARLMDPHAAEDVTQDVFMRINRSRNSHEVRSTKAWVFSVARSAVVDHVRRQCRRPESCWVDEGFDIPAADSDAAEGMFRQEDAKTVFLALARLRPRYRSALILREMHGLTSAEIGEAMALKAGAVDTLVCRARDAFGREYASMCDLGAECRRAVEYIYRERGTGIEPAEARWLDGHERSCPRCAAERTLANSPGHLALLLPATGVRLDGGIAVLQRAWETLGAAPASTEALGVLGAKFTAAALGVAVLMTSATALRPMVDWSEPPFSASVTPQVVVPMARELPGAPAASQDDPRPLAEVESEARDDSVPEPGKASPAATSTARSAASSAPTLPAATMQTARRRQGSGSDDSRGFDREGRAGRAAAQPGSATAETDRTAGRDRRRAGAVTATTSVDVEPTESTEPSAEDATQSE